MSKLAIIGSGSWGTALAISLAERFKHVMIWSRHRDAAEQLQQSRINSKYLPGFSLPEAVTASDCLRSVLNDADLIISVVPAQATRDVYGAMLSYLKPDVPLVSASKGIENGTLLRISSVIGEIVSARFVPQVAVLSGPTFAREVAAGKPAALVLGCTDQKLAARLQRSLATRSLRLYTSADMIGIELGAALKNVVAIGAGICEGLGLGSNSVAALITRGLAEISRLAITLGGAERTLAGLTGLGDLVLTCTGELSRNRQVGIALGHGKTLAEILAGMSMVAEGVTTCRAANQLREEIGLDMPILEKMHEILYEAKAPPTAIRELMDRPLTNE